MKVILPESKILLLKEYIVNPQSTDLNSGSRMYFAIFESDILFYNSNNGSSVIDFVNKHSNDFGKAYFIFKSNFNKISYGSNGVNSFTELLGSFFPKLVTGTIFPSTRSIVLNYNKNYDVKRSNEVYKLMKMPQLQGYSFSLVKGNRNSSSPLSKNYALRKKDDNYPTKFYHGTVLQFADLILKQGLKPGGKKSNWRVKHDKTVFITSEFSLAKKFARATSERNGGIPCVLEVNASKLDTSLFAFDYDIYNTYTDANFDSDYEKSKQVAHINGAKYHKASPIKSTADPRSYIKVGYRGIILPSMFTKIYIDYPTKRVALTPQEYLKKNMNESVEDDEYMIGAEGDGGNNEYFHVEEGTNGNSTVRLYQSTTAEGLDGILNDGVIDAQKGVRRGETSGINWFSIKPIDNFGGSSYSIDVPQSEFKTLGLHFMNNSHIATDKPISIEGLNLQITKLGGLSLNTIKNVFHKSDNDIFKVAETLDKLISDNDYVYLTLDDKCMQQLVKQIIGDKPLRDEGFISENQELEVRPDEVKLDSFKKEKHLAPKIWKGMLINYKVRLKLLDIADDFWDYCNLSWVKPKGIHLTGSICNYNWSKFSDIDLHLVVDFSEISDNKEFVQEYFNDKKNAWNDEHDGLKIYGFPVELYVEDVDAETKSGGVFDLEKNAWIKVPNPDDIHSIELDKYEIKNKSANIMTKIDDYYDLLNSTNDSDKLLKLNKKVQKLSKRLKNMRQFGLKRGGETDPYNIVYKVLKRLGYIESLWQIKNISYDKYQSID